MVQGHQMGGMCEYDAVAVWNKVVLGLDRRGSAGWISDPPRVPVEDTGLDTPMGRLA